MAKVVEVKKLKKSFKVGDTVLDIVKELNFEIESNDFVIFFGPSGCGKSTLLNVMCGLEPPTEGKVLIRGEDISRYNNNQIAVFRQSKVGIIFQSFNLLKTMTIKENVGLPLIAAGKSTGVVSKRAENLLHTFGLSKHIDKVPTELSGGQQQRVAMARALASNPWILVCDEPTGNLDSKSADEVMQIFYLLNRKSKRTILMVTHNPDYLKFANKVFYMKDGTIEKIKHNSARPAIGKVADFSLSSVSIDQS